MQLLSCQYLLVCNGVIEESCIHSYISRPTKGNHVALLKF
jgi:hypothetical protein